MITYDQISKIDLEDITDYYEKYLNSGEVLRTSIREAFAAHEYFGFKAMDGGEPVGYFTFHEGIRMTYPHEDLEERIRRVADGEKIATVDALIVAHKYRGLGIANQLAKRNIKELTRRGFGLFMVEIWVYPDGTIPAKNVYEKMGTIVDSEMVEGFYQDAHTYGISCPICGERCVCGALLEVIRIDHTGG